MINKYESWHLHHLARRAKIFGIEEELISALEKAGWLIAKDKPIPTSLENLVEKAFERLGSIKDFEKTCEDLNCPICTRVVKEYSKDFVLSKPFKLKIELYRWQKEAKEKWWENNGRGIVKVVTGAGKTIFALSIVSELYNFEAYKDGGLKTIIIVPTSVLLDQWLVEVIEKLNLPKNEVAVFYGKEKTPLEGRKIIIYVINSARRYLKDHIEDYFPKEDIFLIADECHRYGSKENSKIFEVSYSFTLGLSATPERFGDMGFEKKLLPNLGKIIYSYTYSDALKDGIIPPYKLIRLKVSLSKMEEFEYERFSKKIGKTSKALLIKYPELNKCNPMDFTKKLGEIYDRTRDSIIPLYTSLLNRRKSIIHTSKSKLEALKWLIEEENLRNSKVLIFHERIEIADQIYEYLKERGFNVGIYHTGLKTEERIKNISDYRNGVINILVSCRALDEGFDVPKSEVGIIVAGTSSVRQWIQRMGRILRKTPDKEYSRIYVVFADLVEKDVFKETELKEFEKEAISVELINLTYR